MGLFGGKKTGITSGPLAPVPQATGVNQFYTQHTNELALKIRERKIAISGDDFAIKDAITNQTVFNVHGKALSFSGKKRVCDASGADLFTIKKRHLSVKKTYLGVDSKTGKQIFKIEKHLLSIGTKLDITFANFAGGGADMTLYLRGDLFDRKAEITLPTGQPVARITREFANAGQLFFDKQTYVLTVAPNVDASLLVAVCVTLDEIANESE